MQVPDALRWWAETPEGAAWLERLPQLVDECAATWGLEVGAPFGGNVAYVARARRARGERVVLKINFPDYESEHEAAALEHYGPHAARVLERDPERRPFERALVDEAVAALEALGPTQPDEVVLHQDLHGGNVLRGTRAPWLVIDPKPLAGERAFDLVALARNLPDRALVRRVALAAGVDAERALGWAQAHALAWGYEPGDRWTPWMVGVARTLSRRGR